MALKEIIFLPYRCFTGYYFNYDLTILAFDTTSSLGLSAILLAGLKKGIAFIGTQ